MGLGLPFQGTICFRNETGYGDGGSGPGWAVSDKVYDVKIDWGDTFKGLRGISGPSVCAYLSVPSDITLHLEYVWQDTVSSVASYCIERTTAGDMTSLVFDIGVNTSGTVKSYYLVKGAKCKTFNLKASSGNEFICTADFSCTSITLGTANTFTPVMSSGASYAYFNHVGVIAKKNTSTAIATIVDGIDITVDQGLTDYWNVASPYKVASVPGEQNITGTVDISLDDGGKVFADVLYTDLTNIYIEGGMTYEQKLTLANVRWDGLTIDVNNSKDIVKTGQKFRAKTITIA